MNSVSLSLKPCRRILSRSGNRKKRARIGLGFPLMDLPVDALNLDAASWILKAERRFQELA